MSESHKIFCEELGNTTYKLKNETIKQQDEVFKNTLGISREEVKNMEEDEFHKLLENRTGKKIGYDKHTKIDCCEPTTLSEIESR